MTNTERATTLLNSFADEFSKSDFPARVARVLISAPEIPSSKWSLGNQMLMLFQGTTDARGFNQWNKVGRYVKKGSKAIYILAPLITQKEDEKTGEKKPIIVGFRGLPVFKYENTEGAGLKTYEPKTIPPLYALAAKNDIKVEYKNSMHGESGSIHVPTATITLSTENPTTWLHELMHFYDAKTHELKPEQDPIQEIVAQFGACVLASMHGIDDKAYTMQYVGAYLKTKDPQKIGAACFKVLARVQKAMDLMLADAAEIQPEAIPA